MTRRNRSRSGVSDLTFRVARVRADTRDLCRILNRVVFPDHELTMLRRRLRDLRRDLKRIHRRVHASGEIFDLENAQMIIVARAYARVLIRALAILRTHEPFYVRVRSSASTEPYEYVRGLASVIRSSLDAIAIDASAADLTCLSHLNKRNPVDLLINVIWTPETTWPATIASKVAAQSREIYPDVFQVIGKSH